MKQKLLSRFTFGNLKPAQQIVISFIGVIFTGGFLLWLPISNNPDVPAAPFLDHLFTATSAVCVTGLAVIFPGVQYTWVGQLIMIFLMQIGGLGLMTMIAAFVIYLGSRMTLSDRLSILEAINRSGLKDFRRFVLNIIKYTFVFESIGFLILCIQFVPEFGWARGSYTALFTAVSAFCNAGFDNIGTENLIPYVSNPIVSLTVASLIVMGGLGFGVWFDLSRASKSVLKRNQTLRRIAHHLMTHTKLAIFMTVSLILSGMVLIFLVEYTNPNSLGPLDFGTQLLASLFQSVTLRTAGFSTLNIGLLRPATQLLMIIYMFIGGSPGGTAGGIKTTTLAILILMIWAEINNQKDIRVFGHTIAREQFRKAFVVFFALLVTLLTGIVLLTLIEPFDFLSIAFEATSAIGTVGLSMGITTALSDWGKIIIMMLMYLGRIGPLTLVLSIGDHTKHLKSNDLTYPSANILIG